MPNHEQPRVVPVDGEIFRYYVHSYSNPSAIYLVDLSEENGQGTCSCTHHGVRIVALRKEGKQARCKHVSAARDFSWPIFCRAFLKEWQNRGKKVTTPKSFVVPDSQSQPDCQAEEEAETGECP